MTREQGRMRTWRFPRFSALYMFFKQSASTLIFTICGEELMEGRREEWEMGGGRRREGKRDRRDGRDERAEGEGGRGDSEGSSVSE